MYDYDEEARKLHAELQTQEMGENEELAVSLIKEYLRGAWNAATDRADRCVLDM